MPFKLTGRSGHALVERGVVITPYPLLDAWSNAIAAEITSWGDPRGRTVGILAPASTHFAAAFLGCWKAGAIAVPLQPKHPIPELEYLVADAKIERAFVHAALAPLGKKLGLKPAPWPVERPDFSTPYIATPGDGALIIYTSGTTSRPKGVVTTRQALEAQIACLREAWRWSSNDRTLNVLPLHHVHGLVNILLCSLACGARCELADKFDPEYTWRKMEEITVFMAVPTIYAKLVEHWEKQDAATQAQWSGFARRLRLVVSGSAALPAPLFRRWEEITGHRLLERYGMTEIGMALSNPYEGERRVGTVGKPLPGVEVRLAEGEIQVRGANVFREYWGRPAGDCFTEDGWFRTGDIAELDEKGYYRILGRASQDILNPVATRSPRSRSRVRCWSIRGCAKSPSSACRTRLGASASRPCTWDPSFPRSCGPSLKSGSLPTKFLPSGFPSTLCRETRWEKCKSPS
jgi:malonyl-CoA/methylmalonyl-CoA synthetase